MAIQFEPGNGVGVGQNISTIAFVIAGAVVVMTLVRFFPKIGGLVLLAVTLLLLDTLFMGRSTR